MPQFFKPSLLIIFFTIPVIFSFGQTIASSQQADSSLRSLAAAKPDTVKAHKLLDIAFYHIAQQEFSRDKTKKHDSLILNLIRQAEALSNRLHSAKYQHEVLRCYARYNFVLGDFDKSRYYSMRLVLDYRRAGDIYGEAKSWSEMSDNIHSNDTLRSPLRLSGYQNAYQLFKKGHYRLEEIEAYRKIADIHFVQGKLDLAEKEMLYVVAQNRKLGYKNPYLSYYTLASIYREKNEQQKELKYRLLMVESMEGTVSVQHKAHLMHNLANLYMAIGRNDKAIYWALKVRSIYKNENHDDYYYGAVCSAAQAYERNGNFDKALALLTEVQQEKGKSHFATFIIDNCTGNYYLATKKYERSESYYLKAHKFILDQGSPRSLQRSKKSIEIGMANIKIQQLKFGEARKYLTQSDTAYVLKDNKLNSKFELASFRVDSAEGHYKSALGHYIKYKQLNESVDNLVKTGQIAEMEVKYETREKEQSIKLLNSEAQSQKARMDKINLQRNITFAALLLLILIGVISYRFYLYKQRNTRSILKKHKLIQSQNEQLNLLLGEKEWLLKEVHHRVKNNLHTIICLLESQAAFLHGDSLQVMENSQNRIFTMSLIHQKLYQSEDIKTIEMSVYIPELVQHLKDSLGAPSDKIHFNLEIEKIGLTQAIAIPIALIINEAITNSIKYAFPGNSAGEIFISLKEENGLIELELSDNGIGMDKNMDDIESRSLGFQLIKGLSKEIQGDLKIKSKRGVKITIVFHQHLWNNQEYQQSYHDLAG